MGGHMTQETPASAIQSVLVSTIVAAIMPPHALAYRHLCDKFGCSFAQQSLPRSPSFYEFVCSCAGPGTYISIARNMLHCNVHQILGLFSLFGLEACDCFFVVS